VRYSVLSPATIWASAVVILVVGAGVAVWLLLAYGRGDEQARTQLEAIKTAGTIAIGAGGAAALLLAARRQRTAEIALKQKDRDQADAARAYALQERVAAAAEADAAARRITELYTKAADQLGSEKAPVRLAGLYALERLAQDNLSQRQTIVNVLCAYLRMPYEPPDLLLVQDSDQQIMGEQREWAQEGEVRRTAQRLLTLHLRPGDDLAHPAGTFWPNIDLDLAGATLVGVDFSGCVLGIVNFAATRFTGMTWFTATQFCGDARFSEAIFSDTVWFDRAQFCGSARFRGAQFRGIACFDRAQFEVAAQFIEAQFRGDAGFDEAQFRSHARFGGAEFNGIARFANAQFHRTAWFEEARFRGDARFGGTQLNIVHYDEAQFAQGVPEELARLGRTADRGSPVGKDRDG
jgi:uncharacterized protein YjbI with pentapeptide repeats